MKTHTLVIEVSDEIYQWLTEIAEREGKTAEQVAVEILEMSVRKKKTESL
jgi:predicted transcriptional regulator